MTPLRDMKNIGIINLRAAVIVEAGGLSKGTEDIQNGEGICGFL